MTGRMPVVDTKSTRPPGGVGGERVYSRESATGGLARHASGSRPTRGVPAARRMLQLPLSRRGDGLTEIGVKSRAAVGPKHGRRTTRPDDLGRRLFSDAR